MVPNVTMNGEIRRNATQAAAGQMLVLIVGGFDLSQGAVVALTSVSSALVMVAFKDTPPFTSPTVRRRPRSHHPGRRSRRPGMRRHPLMSAPVSSAADSRGL